MPTIHAQQLAGQTLETDICIVGAGAAGITVAREFAGRSAQVCLVEAGGLERDADTQTLYAGAADGAIRSSYTTTTRQRYFGGSTNCWSGWCRPFDAIDFEAKPWLPHSVAWPFTRADLDAYYKRAARVVEVEPFDDLSREEPGDLGDLRVLPIRDSPPTRFGTKYRQQLTEARNINVVLFANAKEFVPNAARTRVEVLEVVARDAPVSKIRARLFVLASGGMENPRILLNSHRAIENGAGHSDVLGRFFMAHTPIWGCGVATFAGSFLDGLTDGVKPSPGHPTLTLSDDAQRRNRLMNAGFHLLLTQAAEPSTGVVEALHPLFSSGHEARTFEILAVPEPSPSPDNRITLSDERDAIGMRKLKVHYEIAQQDIVSLERSFDVLARAIGAIGAGRLKSIDWERRGPLVPNEHHMGATRMHADPAFGVVDGDCRVHGLDNLFVAGSSVFPSGSWCNPTLTIVALALRLADHLKAAL